MVNEGSFDTLNGEAKNIINKLSFSGIYRLFFEIYQNRFLIYVYTNSSHDGIRVDFDLTKKQIEACPLIENAPQYDNGFIIN